MLLIQSGALTFALFVLHLNLDAWLLGSVLAALLVLNLMTFTRLHSPLPVTDWELFSQVCADVVLYGCLLYQSGGATNPFIFILLIPLLITAATLPKGFTLLMALMVVTLYSILLRHFQPLIEPGDSHQHILLNLFDLHITGMWINFLFTVLLVIWFINRMQLSLDRQRQVLQQEREKQIQDQQLLSLATMAAGTAHELGTPLATMKVTLKEMALDHPDSPQLQEDIALLQEQVEQCSQRLRQLAHKVRDEQVSGPAVPLKTLLDGVIEEWGLMRPEVGYRLDVSISEESLVQDSTTLRQALLNLLNNAADACPDEIEIQLSDTDSGQAALLKIRDHGPGLPLEQADQLGKPFVTTKGRGLGIGLFLTTSTLARHQGEVRLYNHPEGGTLTEVCLPLLPPRQKDNVDA
ncbi:ATP-binding protein [Marinobacterium sediminicola]|uniref:histidine kinase n=1 Tax=Marinobacterium sediminicola TaxID=518898 RepID=A0ABY1S083_9GAMM|nr:ATP-binding protein [Marinobacterium sediminicola]ULG69666.1 ATP-binding protein [Marinobacterium sediminicola]SMR74606.1 two-component system, sensor histidine kinase RegB [Marinobacterium sediminicola]